MWRHTFTVWVAPVVHSVPHFRLSQYLFGKDRNSWSPSVLAGGFRKASGKFSLVQTDYTDVKAAVAVASGSVSASSNSSSATIDLTSDAASVSTVPARAEIDFPIGSILNSLKWHCKNSKLIHKKMPLGKLSRSSLLRGFDILNAIERLIKLGETADSSFVSLTKKMSML